MGRKIATLGGAIAPQLPADRRDTAAKRTANEGGAKTLGMKKSNFLPFRKTQLAISFHGNVSSWFYHLPDTKQAETLHFTLETAPAPGRQVDCPTLHRGILEV